MYLLVLSLLDGPPEAAADEESIQRLVALAKQGDELAARRLYRQFVARVFRAVRPLAASEADAEDVVQDTFVQALGSLHRYQRRPGKRFMAWLMTIALNTARKQARRSQRWRPAPAELADHEARLGDPPRVLDGALDRRRLAEALLQALDELGERERRIVLLRYGAELSAVEVGELLHESPAAVRKVCQRQREKLIKRLAQLTRRSRQELSLQVRESAP